LDTKKLSGWKLDNEVVPSTFSKRKKHPKTALDKCVQNGGFRRISFRRRIHDCTIRSRSDRTYVRAPIYVGSH